MIREKVLLVHKLVSEARLFATLGEDFIPGEIEIEEILRGCEERVDAALATLIASNCSMLINMQDELLVFEEVGPPPRPPLWFWDLFSATDLKMFGSRLLEDGERVGRVDMGQQVITKGDAHHPDSNVLTDVSLPGLESDLLGPEAFPQMAWLSSYDMDMYRWAGNETEWTEYAMRIRPDLLTYLTKEQDDGSISVVSRVIRDSGCEISVQVECLHDSTEHFLVFVRGTSGTDVNARFITALDMIATILMDAISSENIQDTASWQKDAGMLVIEEAWDQEYAMLSAEGMQASVPFLDYRVDFDQNWPKLLLLLAHICRNVYSFTAEMDVKKDEHFGDMLRKICSYELGIESVVRHEGTMLPAEQDEGFIQEVKHSYDDIQYPNQEHTATNKEKAQNYFQTSEDLKLDIFTRLRYIFPCAEELGDFANDAVSNEDIQAVLAAYDYDFTQSLLHLQNTKEGKQRSTTTYASKLLEHSNVFLARDLMLQQESIQRLKHASLPAKERTPRAIISSTHLEVDWDCCVSCCKRMLALDMNRFTSPKIACDYSRGLILKGWGASPESGSLLGSPFSKDVEVRRLDLHTVRVKEALQLVDSILCLYSEADDSMRPRRRFELGLLVGKGLHSSRTGPCLGPNIVALLRRRRVRFREEVAWLVLTGLS